MTEEQALDLAILSLRADVDPESLHMADWIRLNDHAQEALTIIITLRSRMRE